jgi:hypothetical protein
MVVMSMTRSRQSHRHIFLEQMIQKTLGACKTKKIVNILKKYIHENDSCGASGKNFLLQHFFFVTDTATG